MKIIFCCKEMREAWHDGSVGINENSNHWYLKLHIAHVVNSNPDNRNRNIRICPFCGSKMVVKQRRKYR